MRAHRAVSLGFVVLAVASAVLAVQLGSASGAARRTSARRVIADSPALVELLFAIGAGDRAVGRTHFATYPPAALALPDTGGALDPNLEVMASLRPDCLLLQMKNERVDGFAAERGIHVERFKIESVADVLAATTRLGELTDQQESAAREVARLEAAIDRARARAPRARPRVLVSCERTPGELRGVGTVGSGTFVMECVAAAGGDPALAVKGYTPVSNEAIVDARPDVVIELRTEPATAEELWALRHDWEATLPDLPAVKNHRVKVVYHPDALVPGPRLDQVIEAFSRALEGVP
jgi:iron complex transport system substrate-binding protein